MLCGNLSPVMGSYPQVFESPKQRMFLILGWRIDYLRMSYAIDSKLEILGFDDLHMT